MTNLVEAAKVLEAGDPLIFETDTVVGIGVSVRHSETPLSLYEAKERNSDKPIAWLISDVTDLAKFGADVPDYAYAIANEYWPGAVTLIVNASDKVPQAYRSSTGSIGLRMPDAKPIADLMDMIASPIATTSANFSNMPAVGSIHELDPVFAPHVARLVHFDRNTPISAASTVIDCTGSAPVIVRAGTITQSDISNYL